MISTGAFATFAEKMLVRSKQVTSLSEQIHSQILQECLRTITVDLSTHLQDNWCVLGTWILRFINTVLFH